MSELTNPDTWTARGEPFVDVMVLSDPGGVSLGDAAAQAAGKWGCDCGADVRVEATGPSTLRFWHLSGSLASGQHTFRRAGLKVPPGIG